MTKEYLDKFVDNLSSDSISIYILNIDSSDTMYPKRQLVKRGLQRIRESLSLLDEKNSIFFIRNDFSGHNSLYGKEEILNSVDELDVEFFPTGKTIFYHSIWYLTEKIILGENGLIESLLARHCSIRVSLITISDGKDNGSEEGHVYENIAADCIRRLNENKVATVFFAVGKKAVKRVKKLGFQFVFDIKNSEESIYEVFEYIYQNIVKQSESIVSDELILKIDNL